MLTGLASAGFHPSAAPYCSATFVARSRISATTSPGTRSSGFCTTTGSNRLPSGPDEHRGRRSYRRIGDGLAACDLFTVEVLTLAGLKRYLVVFVIELETRRVTATAGQPGRRRGAAGALRRTSQLLLPRGRTRGRLSICTLRDGRGRKRARRCRSPLGRRMHPPPSLGRRAWRLLVCRALSTCTIQ